MAPVHSIPNSVDNVDNVPPDQVSKASPAVEAGPAEMHSSASSKSDHDDVVKGENKYQKSFAWRLHAYIWVAILLLCGFLLGFQIYLLWLALFVILEARACFEALNYQD